MTRILPVLRYPGAKWRLAPWIIAHMPPHEAYVEPFFGSGAVLLCKYPARSELINDIDGSVVAFFRVLRDRPDELARAIALTPYAREELHFARGPEVDDDLERARRLAIACWQTRGGSLSRRHPGWRFDIHGAANQSLAATWSSLPERLMEATLRLRHVAIDNRPALHVIELARKRGADTLIYADPPYLGRTLANGATAQQFRLYPHEMTLPEHAELLEALDRHPGPVVLSGYPSELYTSRLAGWTSLLHESRNQVNDFRTEVLWLNAVAARHVMLPLELTGGARLSGLARVVPPGSMPVSPCRHEGAPTTLALSRQPNSEGAAVSLRSSLGDRAPIITPSGADEALAIGSVLYGAHGRARSLASQLELEAADPRVRQLYDRAKDLQRGIAGLIVEIASDAVRVDGRRSPVSAVLDRDCRTCLVDVERCSILSTAGDRCCSECSHA